MTLVQPPNDINIFERKQIARYRKRCAPNLADHDFLFRWASNQILERLDLIKRDFKNILQIGERDTQTLPQLQNSNINTIQIDLNSNFNSTITADEEFLPIKPESQDLIISNLGLHSINDLPGTLLQIKQALKPDGLFIAALFGGSTLTQLRDSLMQAELKLKGGISPRVSPFADKQDCGALLQRAGFALPVIDSDCLTVTYDNMFKLMNDLRGMGESNAITARNKINPGKQLFIEAAQIYQEKYAEPDNRIPATFEIIFLLGWAPHDSQQKPLKPGSAKHSLATALGTEEQSTGDSP